MTLSSLSHDNGAFSLEATFRTHLRVMFTRVRTQPKRETTRERRVPTSPSLSLSLEFSVRVVAPREVERVVGFWRQSRGGDTQITNQSSLVGAVKKKSPSECELLVSVCKSVAACTRTRYRMVTRAIPVSTRGYASQGKRRVVILVAVRFASLHVPYTQAFKAKANAGFSVSVRTHRKPLPPSLPPLCSLSNA